MTITILTLFPKVFEPILASSMLLKAQNKGFVEYRVVDLRDFGEDKRHAVDDRPYGGGAGMILRPNVLALAIKTITRDNPACIVLMSAGGKRFDDAKAREFVKIPHILIICGHYEGVDQRFVENYVDEEVSVGDFIMTGGEIPAMAVVDAVTRLIPGVLKEEASQNESFAQGLLEYPHYTRPEIFEGKSVPQVLLSGNHEKIAKWREEQSVRKTQMSRADLLKKPRH